LKHTDNIFVTGLILYDPIASEPWHSQYKHQGIEIHIYFWHFFGRRICFSNSDTCLCELPFFPVSSFPSSCMYAIYIYIYISYLWCLIPFNSTCVAEFLNIYLIDAVSGSVVFSVSHKRAREPVHIVHSENWLLYSYFSDKSRRTEIVTLELYEGKVQSNTTGKTWNTSLSLWLVRFTARSMKWIYNEEIMSISMLLLWNKWINFSCICLSKVLANLGDIWLSQHHTVCQLKLIFDTEELTVIMSHLIWCRYCIVK